MKFQWVFEQQANYKELKDFAKEISTPATIANILINRGIKTREEAVRFFSPKIKNLHNPFLMKDMDKAVERLLKAFEKNEKILVYGDYDTDGTTAVSLMYLFLLNFGNNVDYYIPDRYTEGYGVSFKGIDYAAENDVSLIVALDCGIKANEQVKYAKNKNIDFIICDHHTPGEQLPEAVAVLDPKREDCDYPYKELTGCGVGFKLAEAIAEKKEIDKTLAYQHLDLVAISIAADIVPITGENRILEYFGLKVLKKTLKPGLQALLDLAGLKNKEITVSDCVFKISPRINAAGRLEHASNSVKLLITDDYEQGLELGKKLNELNAQRQKLDREITDEIIEIFDNSPELKQRKSTVLYNENWHKGVIGIVASKVIEKYYKPTIIFTKSEGKLTGSARSVEGFDLYEAISNCSQFLVSFGGHKFAAGLTITEENLEKFKDCFENTVNEYITFEQQKPKLYIADILQFSDITNRLLEILSHFAPFGPGNMKPVFFTSNVRDVGGTALIGSNSEHLKLEITDPTGFILEAVAFNMGEYFQQIKSKSFDICYTINKSPYGNSVQLQIKDIRVHY